MNSVGPYEAVALYKSVPYMCVYARARARVCMWVGARVRTDRNTHVRYISRTKECV